MKIHRFALVTCLIVLVQALILSAIPGIAPVYAQADCDGAPAPLLLVGAMGHVSNEGANNMRNAASTNGDLITQIPSGAEFTVLEGPICADGFNWWRVDFDGIIGWTAEGQGDDYWLEPVEMTAEDSTADTTSEPRCPNFLPSRLIIGERGRVVPGPSNNLRAEPDSSTELLREMPGGTEFIVLEGPICASSLAWWRVDYLGTMGWTAEGIDTTYWLEPLGPVPTPAPTLTPAPTQTPFPTQTPLPTSTPLPQPPPVHRIEGLQSRINQPIPAERDIITPQNVDQLELLSVIGRGGLGSMQISDDGTWLMVTGGIGIWLQSLTDDSEPYLLDTGDLAVTAIKFSADSRYLALGGAYRAGMASPTVRLWDLEERAWLPVLEDMQISVTALAFTPTNQILVGGSLLNSRGERRTDLYLLRWSAGTTDPLSTNIEGDYTDIVISRNGSLLAAPTTLGQIELYSLEGMEHQILFAVDEAINDIQFDAAGSRLLATRTFSPMVIWSTLTTERMDVSALPASASALALSPDGETLAVLSDATRVTLFDANTLREINSFSSIEGQNFSTEKDRFYTIAFTSDGRIAIGYQTGQVRLWDGESPALETIADFSGFGFSSPLIVTEDGHLLVIGSMGGNQLMLWDTLSAVARTYETPSAIASNIRFIEGDNSGFYFSSGDEDYRFDFDDNSISEVSNAPTYIAEDRQPARDLGFDLYTPSEQQVLRRPQDAIFSPNNDLLVTDDWDTLTFYDVAGRTPELRVNHSGGIDQFSTDQTLFITQTQGAIWLWGIPHQ
jgi:WD40 repeat protein